MRYSPSEVAEAAALSRSFSDLARRLKTTSRSYVKLVTERYGVSTQHFVGLHRKYTKDVLEPIVAVSHSFAEVTRRLSGSTHGGTSAHIKKVIERFGIDTSHFRKGVLNKGKPSARKKNSEEVLVVYPAGTPRRKAYLLRRALVDSGRKLECQECHQGPTWNGKPLTLQVDHIDGNTLNCLAPNLRFICPNCHSQTETYGSKNRLKLGESNANPQ
jgi:hypothetical protein